ncbi:hypothetical protein Hanom_Chr05g00455651 [Helianthus anomalus]
MQQIHNINTINTPGGHFFDNNITTNMPLLKLRISNSFPALILPGFLRRFFKKLERPGIRWSGIPRVWFAHI